MTRRRPGVSPAYFAHLTLLAVITTIVVGLAFVALHFTDEASNTPRPTIHTGDTPSGDHVEVTP